MTSEENNKEINPVYEEGDFVVYPAHGVGYVIGIEKVEISGSLLELVKVRFDSDRMTLRIPVNKAVSSGLRKLSSKKQMEAAFNASKVAQCNNDGDSKILEVGSWEFIL